MTTIAIAGVGALGSHVAMLLRNTDATLRIIDNDRIEGKNVASQFHARGAIGKSKVVGLQQTMQLLFGRKLEAIPHRIVANNVETLIGGVDLVLDCLDNAPSRRLVQVAASAQETPCLHGALAAAGAFGRVIWDEQFAIEEAPAGAATCEDGNHLPFICLVAAYISHAAQTFLLTGNRLSYHIHPGGATAAY